MWDFDLLNLKQNNKTTTTTKSKDKDNQDVKDILLSEVILKVEVLWMEENDW